MSAAERLTNELAGRTAADAALAMAELERRRALAPAPDGDGGGGGDGDVEPTGVETCAADWRFLLPDADLGHVAILGRPRPELLRSLEAVAATVAREDEIEPGRTYDTVVAVRGGRRTVARALPLLAPAGVLRIERVKRLGRRSLMDLLRAQGFSPPELYWHRPNLARTTVLVRLRDRSGGAAVLRLSRSGPKRVVEQRLLRAGAVELGAGAVSLLALAPGYSPLPAVAAPAADVPAGLLTPRFAASQAVIGVATSADGRLKAVAKVPRTPRGSRLVAREGAALDALTNDGRLDGVPAHELTTRGGRTVLLEAAATGLPLDPHRVRTDPMSALETGMDWLDAMPTVPTVPDFVADLRHDRLIGGAAGRLRSAGPTHDPVRAAAVATTLELLEPLRTAGLPDVFEHGDFSHPNLFVDGDHLSVIDWEHALQHGLPLHDAFFFCGYLSQAVDRPTDPGAAVDAYLRAAGTHGWARAWIERHAERMGVERRHLRMLELSSWFRATARVERDPRRSDSRPLHRNEAIWRVLVDEMRRAGS